MPSSTISQTQCTLLVPLQRKPSDFPIFLFFAREDFALFRTSREHSFIIHSSIEYKKSTFENLDNYVKKALAAFPQKKKRHIEPCIEGEPICPFLR